MPSNTLNAASLADFLGLGAAERGALAKHRHVFERSIEQALDHFYAEVRRFAPAMRYFSDENHLQRARQAQLRHWRTLMEGRFDNNYQLRVQRIGAAHARIGLDHRVYLSGYALVIDGALNSVCRLRADAAGDDDAASIGMASSALLKCALLDMSMVVEAYLEASEARSAARSRFLANMGHDLRTSLNTVIGYAELTLEEMSSRPQAAQDTNHILGAAFRLLRLANGLIELAKIEAGEADLAFESVDPIQLTQALIADADAEGAGNSTKMVAEGEIGRLTTDPDKLRRCLAILLGNANRFTRNGAVTIRIARRTERIGQVIVYEVADTGIGMSKEQIARFFGDAPFSAEIQVNRSGGAGLGLAIARALARCLGGDLSVESEPGSGTTFRLVVPVDPAAGG